MRVKATVINSSFNVISQFIQLVLSFIIRNLFIQYIGIQLLGLSGLFSNILFALNLADLGIGAAITYYLYKPVAENDIPKIKGLMRFYKKTYFTIGIFVFVAGLLLLPFLHYLIKDQNLDLNLIRIIYLIQLTSTASTYFLSYRRTLLFVDQKSYIASIVDSIANILMMVLRIVAIAVFKSYVIYTVVILAQTILSNLIISMLCTSRYPYLADNSIPSEQVNTNDVHRDLKNIIVEKIVSYIHYSTDNIIVSKFLGLTSTGLLSNYTLIYTTVQTFFVQMTNAVQASFGNYINSGNSERDVYQVYKRFSFLCYWISSFCIVSFMVLIQPFIGLWLGEKYLLPESIIFILSASFFISSMRQPLVQMVSIYGLFREMKYVAIIAAVMNLSVSIILVQSIGIAGTLIGTMISETIYWIGQTRYVITKRMNIPYYKSIHQNGIFILATLAIILITTFLSSTIFRTATILAFIGKAGLCVIIPNCLNSLLFRNTEELKYYKKLLILAYNKGYARIKK